MSHVLHLIRWKNLVLIALVQLLIRYALLLPFQQSHGVVITLTDLAFGLLVFATLCIASGGYIINDIYDVEADKINKPNSVIIDKFISEKKALYGFIVLNVLGVGIGFYLSNSIDKSGFSVLFFMASLLLYIYSSYLKHIPMVGNIAVSFIIVLAIFLVGIFELLPPITASNRAVQITFFKIIVDYALFAFFINLLREIVKDIEDINGDYKVGSKTLPIVLGRARCSKFAFGFSVVLVFTVTYYVVTYLFKQSLFVIYFLVFVIGPLLYVCIKLFNAEEKEHYTHISKILKVIMFFGLLSLGLYPFVLN